MEVQENFAFKFLPQLFKNKIMHIFNVFYSSVCSR